MLKLDSQAVVRKINENAELMKLNALNFQSLYQQFAKYDETVKVLRNDDDVKDKQYLLNPLSQALDFMSERALERLFVDAEEHARLVNNNLFRLLDFFEEFGELAKEIESCIAIVEEKLFEFEEVIHS